VWLFESGGLTLSESVTFAFHWTAPPKGARRNDPLLTKVAKEALERHKA
jgi:hypothetical protein